MFHLACCAFKTFLSLQKGKKKKYCFEPFYFATQDGLATGSTHFVLPGQLVSTVLNVTRLDALANPPLGGKTSTP